METHNTFPAPIPPAPKGKPNRRIVVAVVGGLVACGIVAGAISKQTNGSISAPIIGNDASGAVQETNLAIMEAVWTTLDAETKDNLCLLFTNDADAAAKALNSRMDETTVTAATVREFAEGNC